MNHVYQLAVNLGVRLYLICSPVRSAKKKVEGGWKPTYKIYLLQLVETEEKIFYKEIMRGRIMNL